MDASDEFYKYAFDAAVQGGFQFTPGGKYLRVNAAMAKIFGYASPAEMVKLIKDAGRQIYADPRQYDKFKTLLESEGAVENFESQNKRKDGSIIWTSCDASAVRGPSGRVKYYAGFLRDITEEKAENITPPDSESRYRVIQETIRQSEERFRKVFQASPIATCITTFAEGRFLDANNAYLTLSGFQREQIVGRTAIEMGFIGEVERKKWLRMFRDAGFALSRQNSDFITASGRVLDVIAFFERIELGGQQAIISMFHDTTTQAAAEKALQQSETRYRALVEHIPAVIFMEAATDDQKTIYISPQIADVLGCTAEECLDDPLGWKKNIHPADRKRILERRAESIEDQTPFSGEYRLVTRDRKTVWIQEESSLILDRDGNPLYRQGFLLDITSRKKAQSELTEIAKAYRGLFDSVSDAIYIEDLKGHFLDVNLGAEKMYGYPKKFFLGKTPDALSAPGKNDLKAIEKIMEMARQGHPQQFEFWGRRSNGEIFPKEVHVSKGTYFGKEVIITYARDITERKTAQDARERQLKELTVLHALALEGARAGDEDELIAKATGIIGRAFYTDILGFLMVNEKEGLYRPHPSYRGLTNLEDMRSYRVDEGVVGRVIKNGKALNIGDVRKEKSYLQSDPSIRSELCVPMKIGKRVIGAINAESPESDFFSREDERLLTTIAGQLATAIERLRKERAERDQRLIAEALGDIALALNSALDFNTVMDRILTNIERVVPSEAAIIYLIQNGIATPIRHRGVESRGRAEWINGLRLVCDEVPDFKRAITAHEPQLIQDASTDPDWIRFPETGWIRSHLLAPIQIENNAIGLIALEDSRPSFFTAQDAERLLAFANQAASAIQNARRFQEESRRAQIIEALAEIANIIATTPEVGPTLDKIAERSLKVLNARHIAIYLLQEDNKTLKIVTAQGKYREQLIHHSLKLGSGITGRVVASGKAEIINDLVSDSRRVTVPDTPEEDALLETIMSAPLILREKPIGAINAWRLLENGLFSDTELNFLTGIAHQASIAIESGRLFEELTRRAQESAAIAMVGRDISSTLKLDVVLERIVVYAKDLLRAEASAVYLTVPNRAEMRAIAAMGSDAAAIKNDPLQIGQGILGNIALQKIGEIVNDTAADPRAIIVKGTEAIPHEHIMGVPILSKDQLTGLLAVWRIGEGQDFIQAELNFLDNLAQQAAIAIENARLFHAEQLRRQEAETLREATAVVATTLEHERAIELILDQLARVLQYDSAAVHLLQNGYLEIVGGRGWSSAEAVIGLKFPVPGDNPNTRVIQERKPLVLNSVRGLYAPFEQKPHQHIRSWLGAPLIAHGEIIGMLSVDSKEEGRFNDEHIRLVAAYANQAAIAIDNAQLHEKSEKQVRRLTALRDVDAAIASSLDLRVTLNILMDNAASQLRADAMSILVFNPDIQALETAASLGFEESLARRQVRIGEELAGRVGLTRQTLKIQDFRETAEFARPHWTSEEGFIAYVGFPLIGKGQMKGVLEAFFRSPFTPDNDWLEFMQTMARQAAIAIDNAQLFENLQRTNQDLSLAYDTTLEGWGRALELRDKETEGHTRRVAELTIRLARRMNISDAELTHIYRGVLLHDIGKMGVPDQILRKTGPLNEEEWAEMRKHPQYAFDLLRPIAYLRPALDIPLCHHEKWDGSGYPRGLKGEDIPLAARIFALVDVWDALLSTRPYRQTWTREEALRYIRDEAGTRFDPVIANIFIEMMTNGE
ncbi:MAG: GAF domain-containing protein [Anaerolineales bacterium]|nr:MAG: GAF domain-containing protein [Anaerolineales bacterium]